MTLNLLHDIWRYLPERIVRVESRPIALTEPFIELVRRHAHLPGTVALMSGGKSDCARYHILGIRPWLTVLGDTTKFTLVTPERTVSMAADPFATMDQLLRRYSTLPAAHLPISAGLLGYLSYDLKDCVEELPRTSVDDLGLPHFYLNAPSILILQDCLTGATSLHYPVFDAQRADADIQRWLSEFELTLACPQTVRGAVELRTGAFTSGFTRATYMSAVESIKDYIGRGDVYQVNMSQRFQATFQGDPFDLFANLYRVNPAAFFSYINAGDHQIVSSSPERFIQLNQGAVETRPIKGTRPRGKTADEDLRLRQDLETCPKDDAELSMIVDLLRNDIGKVCRANSVRVTEHKRVEAYENVYHLVSIVKGDLDEDKTAVDLIRATFPGGSITGCPKIRSMEVIDELEPVRRHIYTGSIGYLSFHGTMDLSIAIRTAVVTADNVYFSVGGGIVYDSNPSDEYDETLHKGRTLMRFLESEATHTTTNVPVVWHNGLLKYAHEANVSVDDEGFLYGHGLFETIRVDRGVPQLLEEHIERMHRSWKHCFRSTPPDITWREVLQQVIAANRLEDTTAAVKILIAAGKPQQRQPLGTLLVTAKEYVHRLARVRLPGLCLAVYPQRRLSSLADHKTLNYLSYKLAGNWAAEQGADEALILNEDGTVSETNTANVFCVRSGVVYCPRSAHALAGVTEGAIVRLLESWGMVVEQSLLSLDDLSGADFVFVSNSLMGAVPVAKLEGYCLPLDSDLCTRINVALFGQDFRSAGVTSVTLVPQKSLGGTALTEQSMSSAS